MKIWFNNFNKQKKIRHIVLWLVLIVYISVIKIFEGSFTAEILFVTFFVLNLFIAYYVLVIVGYSFLVKKQYGFIALLIIIFFGIFFAYDCFHYKVILVKLNGHTVRDGLLIKDFLIASLIWYSRVVFAAISSFMLELSSIRQKAILGKEQQFLERELFILKNQFHSHINFNFLNFCYARVLRISANAAEAVEHYTEMLHYTLNQSKQNLVSIESEVEYIQNFIALQSIIASPAYHTFEIDMDNKHYKIQPMLLGILVENAFKHGIANNPDNPIFISIKIKNSVLVLTVNNTALNPQGHITSGVGIDNLKELLKLYYLDKHHLAINYIAEKFTVKLTLEID